MALLAGALRRRWTCSRKRAPRTRRPDGHGTSPGWRARRPGDRAPGPQRGGGRDHARGAGDARPGRRPIRCAPRSPANSRMRSCFRASIRRRRRSSIWRSDGRGGEVARVRRQSPAREVARPLGARRPLRGGRGALRPGDRGRRAPSTPDAGRLLYQRSRLSLKRDMEGQIEATETALASAREVGDRGAETVALGNWLLALTMVGRWEGACERAWRPPPSPIART